MEFQNPTAFSTSSAQSRAQEAPAVRKLVVESKVRKLAIAILFGGVGLAMALSLPASVVVLPVCAFAAASVYCFYRALGGPAYVSLSPKRRCHVLSAPLYYLRRPVRRAYRSGVATLATPSGRACGKARPNRPLFRWPQVAVHQQRRDQERMHNPFATRRTPHRRGMATAS